MLLGIWKENMLEGPNLLDEDRTELFKLILRPVLHSDYLASSGSR